MKTTVLKTIFKAAEDNASIADEQALWILDAGHEELPALLHAANLVRMRNFGNRVKLCSIVNAKRGACRENCSFCAQSIHHPEAEGNRFYRLDAERLVDDRQTASQNPILYFGIVTSGEALHDAELEKIEQALIDSGEDGANWCASLGCLTREQLERLRKAGLKRFHHNLETARSFFPEVCDTHSYDRRLETVREAKAAGLQVCCGGILGLGESNRQRVEMANTLAHLQIDSIPLNFLVPIPGTRLADMPVMSPLKILLSIIMFRLKCPTAEIRLAAGRGHLRRLQGMVFHAGCTGIMVGDLLTISGEDIRDDLQMIRDLGMSPEMPEGVSEANAEFAKWDTNGEDD